MTLNYKNWQLIFFPFHCGMNEKKRHVYWSFFFIYTSLKRKKIKNLCSLISVFVNLFLYSIMPLASIPLASICSCTDHFVSQLVANPEDRFSHNEASFICNLVSDSFIQAEISVNFTILAPYQFSSFELNCIETWSCKQLLNEHGRENGSLSRLNIVALIRIWFSSL